MARKREQTSEGIGHDLEKPEGLVPQQEPQQGPQPEKPQQEEPQQEAQQDEDMEGEEPEKLNRMQCAYRALQLMAQENGTDTLSHLGKVADDLFIAGHDGDQEYSDIEAAQWRVQQVLEHMQGLGLVEMTWECVVVPLVDLRNAKPKTK
jgi:hypothetical protein